MRCRSCCRGVGLNSIIKSEGNHFRNVGVGVQQMALARLERPASSGRQSLENSESRRILGRKSPADGKLISIMHGV